MFGDDAVQIINMLGASGAIPGAISEEDIPAALQRLRQRLQLQATASAQPANPHLGEDDGADHDPPIMLASRAAPLIEILERAIAGKAPVMWETASTTFQM